MRDAGGPFSQPVRAVTSQRSETWIRITAPLEVDEVSQHLLEQVQEVCDRVGIIFRGKLVREGRLDELTAIEDQTEIVLRDATPELIAEIEALAKRHGAGWLQAGKPRTTLERLFLRETQGDDR